MPQLQEHDRIVITNSRKEQERWRKTFPKDLTYLTEKIDGEKRKLPMKLRYKTWTKEEFHFFIRTNFVSTMRFETEWKTIN